MSVNTAHASNGVLIHAGEYILLHSDNVTMEFSAQDNPVFKGSKQGRIYLTSHRMIFNTKKAGDAMQSFSAPFVALNDVELEQPVFGANYIKGKVRAQPNGNFVGEVKFKLYFKAGGAIEYGQALLRAASTAQSNVHRGQFDDNPPPYTPAGAWHEAPPPAYQPPPGYYGWLPTHDAFSGPAPNTVFVSDNPPPYPGIGGPPPYIPPATVPMQPHCTPQQPAPQQPVVQNDQVSWHGFSLPPDQPNGPNQAPPAQAGWGGGNYQPPPYGACNVPGYGVPQQAPYGGPGYPYNQQPQPYPYGGPPAQGLQGGFNYPAGPGNAAGGGPPASGAMGFHPPPNSKEAEALASAYNTPYNQRSDNTRNQAPSDLPPAYNDLPPNYTDYTRKNQ